MTFGVSARTCLTRRASERWVWPMHPSVSDIMLIYVLSAFGALALFVWLGFQIFRLMRSSGEGGEPPAD